GQSGRRRRGPRHLRIWGGSLCRGTRKSLLTKRDSTSYQEPAILQEREDPFVKGIDLGHASDRKAGRLQRGLQPLRGHSLPQGDIEAVSDGQIGRASCRERVESAGGEGSGEEKKRSREQRR